MRKKKYRKILAGLLCAAVLMADFAPVGVRVSAAEQETGQSAESELWSAPDGRETEESAAETGIEESATEEKGDGTGTEASAVEENEYEMGTEMSEEAETESESTVKGTEQDTEEVETETEAETEFVELAADEPTSGTCGDNLTWKLEDGTLTISGTGAMYDYYQTYDNSWRGRHIVNVIIQEGVTHIGKGALCGKSSLTSVTIPGSVGYIGEKAFLDCDYLEEVHISTIESWCNIEFDGYASYPFASAHAWNYKHACNLYVNGNLIENLVIPNSITEIKDYTFYGCSSLASVTIPDSVMRIGSGTFYECSKLTSVYVSSIEHWCDIEFGSLRDAYSLYINGTLIENLIIPDSVTEIKDHAFDGCSSLISVTIPDSVTRIGEEAFSGCSSLTSVAIPDSVTRTGGSAFNGCSSLTSVYITSIESWCNIEFGEEYFTNLSSNPLYYAHNLYVNGNLSQDLIIPNSVAIIKDCVFSGCSSLTSVTIPDSVTRIGSDAFSGCSSLTSVAIPDSVTGIGSYAFSGCSSLTSVTIPDSMTSISACAFSECKSLASVTIPYSVKIIDWAAFNGCNSLVSLKIINPNCDIYNSKHPYDTIPVKTTIYGYLNSTAQSYAERNGNKFVALGTEDDPSDEPTSETADGILRSGDGWTIRWNCTYKRDSEGIPKEGRLEVSVDTADSDTAEELDLCSEEGSSRFPWELEPYNIPKSSITTLFVKGTARKKLRIMESAFKGYSKLKSANFIYVSTIGANAFEDCKWLRDVQFYETPVSIIGDGAFKNCIFLDDISFPSSLEQVGAEAFYNTALATIKLDRNVKAIGKNAFSECGDLLILCYEGSYTHQYAKENNLPFRLIAEDGKPVHIYYGDGNAEGFDHDLEYYISQTGSDAYSPQLSHMLIALSNAVHNERNIKDSMKELGFRYKDMHTRYSENEWRDEISYAFGKKTLSNGKKLVLVTIRGTITSYENWSNLDIGSSVLGCFWHKGFEVAANAVYNDLKNFTGGTFENTTFVITGHSRGGATANLLEVLLFNNKVANADVYGYNFACPDVATGLPTGWNYFGEHNNIFNIGNAPDFISVVPGELGTVLIDILPGTTWGKFGRSFWFSKDWNDPEETRLRFDTVKHNQEVYLDYLRNEPPLNNFKTWEEKNAVLKNSLGRQITVRCPVDVCITDKSGNVVASVKGNVPDYHNAAGNILIFTCGDKKTFFIKEDGQLTVNLTATDSGTMKYMVQNINADTFETIGETTFENVELIKDKQMKGEVNSIEEENITAPDSRLWVLDNVGQPAKEVLPDGKGTEIPITGDYGGVLPEDIPMDGIPAGLWIAGIQDYMYTGMPIKPEVRVYDSDRRLRKGQDYTVGYKNNLRANDASDARKAPTVTVRGKGNYTGTETATFKIQPVNLNDSSILAEDICTAYTGKAQKKIPVLTCHNKKLSNNKDFTVSYPSAAPDAYKAAGTYDILLTAKQGGNYTGTRTVKLTITDSILISRAKVEKIPAQPYTGAAVEPGLNVTCNKIPLTKDRDYTAVYTSNTDVGTAAVTITGIGSYAGTKTVTFKITGISLNKASVTGIENKIYSGTAHKQNLKVVSGNKTLAEGTDYEAFYTNNINAGKATVTIKGINSYAGSIKKTFRIAPCDIGTDTENLLAGLDAAVTEKYVKGGSRPHPQLAYAGRKLTEGKDYTITYRNNRAAASAEARNAPSFTIRGKGNFKGTLTRKFSITGKALDDPESPVRLSVPDKGYSGKAGGYVSTPVLTDTDGKKLTAGTDYEKEIQYTLEDGTPLAKTDKVETGRTIRVKVTGKGAYSGGLEGAYRITENDFARAAVTISPQTYTGKAVTLGKDHVTVKIGKDTLAFGTDYEIVEGSYEDNVKKGTARVTIAGKGSYGGTKTVKFRIMSKKMAWFWRIFG